MTKKKEVAVYADGACSGNPGPGGWGTILIYEGIEKELSGAERDTTNNRMELTAVIEGFRALRYPCSVRVYTDSRYIVDAFRLNWIGDWKSRGWRRKGGELKNPELWQTLTELCQAHEVEFHWVKGHAENPYNNRCDALAVAARLALESPGP